MSEVSKEQLSALLDGELAGDEVRFLLRRIQADPALAEVWARYQLIGDGMRKQVAMPVTSAFAVRVMHQIETEPNNAATTSRPSRSLRWVRYGLGGSIAASVAVAALVWMQPRQDLPTSPSVAEHAVARSAPPVLADQASEPVTSQLAAASTPDLSALLRQPGSYGLNVQPASALRSSGRPILMQSAASAGAQPVWMRVPANDAVRHQPETFYLRAAGSGPPHESARAQLRPH